jgi:hypothetical protein
LEFQTGHADHNLGCFRLLVTSAANPPDANAAAGDVSLSGGAGAADELAAKAALRVVLAAGKALDRLAEQAAQKKLADLTQQIDDVEKQLKYKSRNVEPLLKTLDAALAACNENRMIGEKLIERVAGLRFDAKLGADGELGFYNTTVKSSGAAAEILYDFSTPEQYAAWTLDSPNKDAGAAEHDQKAGTVNVTTRGKHQWDGRDRRDTPVVRLPFFLRGDTWSYEANVVLVSDGNKKDKPDYGILVWDGGGISVRCSVKAFTARDVEALIAAGTPKKDNHWGKTHMAGTTKEWLRMRMTCLGGTVTCTVTSLTTGKTVTLTMKEPIGFEPKYAGFFVRTNDDGENAKAAFSKVRLSGPVNKEKLKEKLDAERLTAVTAAKNEFAKKWGGK